jgi:hypothetical protein
MNLDIATFNGGVQHLTIGKINERKRTSVQLYHMYTAAPLFYLQWLVFGPRVRIGAPKTGLNSPVVKLPLIVPMRYSSVFLYVFHMSVL